MSLSLWYTRTTTITPGGAQTYSRMHGKMGPTSYPIFATRAEGAYLWATADGSTTRKYIDLAGANATAPLGFNRPEIVEAVRAELGSGGTMSLPTKVELYASEKMVEAVPYAEMVRWVRTGSEAVSGAIRCARAVTGKSLVIVFDGAYHGWHPWTADSHGRASLGLSELTADGLDASLWTKQPLSDVAAIVVEPPRFDKIDFAYVRWLEGVRRLCSEHHVALIYDDVVFGFRFATGGLQEATDVRADLACFSKALGNGVPVGCLVGSRDFLKDTPVSSTFGGETTGLAAALAVLRLHESQDICAQLEAVGIAFRSRLVDALKDSPITVHGTPQHFYFQVGGETTGASFNAWLSRCESEGVLIHATANNISLAFTDPIIDRVVDAIERVRMYRDSI